MRPKPSLALAVVLCAQAAFVPCLAEDPDGDAERKFHNGLFFEVAFGSNEARDVNSSIDTTSQNLAETFFTLEDNAYGRGIIGWKLPKNLGSFRVRFEGHKEEDFKLRSIGSSSNVSGTNAQGSLPVQWFSLLAVPGSTTTERTTPTWNSGLDANNNGRPDPDEVVYDTDSEGNTVPDLVISSTAPDDLQNQLQVYDAYYLRRFGGRKTRAEWTAGIRYFVYEGNVPAAAWLNIEIAGVGFTDGALLRPITFNQDTSGIGPNFSLELQHGWFRDRLVVWGQGRGAFVLQSLDADSGDFFTIVRDTTSGTFIPVRARLTESLDKSSWHAGIEVGLSVKLVEGFHLNLAGMIHSYQDAVLLPSDIAIPNTPGQAPQMTNGVFNTHDLRYEGFYGGLSFQF